MRGRAGSGAGWPGPARQETELRAARGEASTEQSRGFLCHMSHVRLITSLSLGLMLSPLIVTIIITNIRPRALCDYSPLQQP